MVEHPAVLGANATQDWRRVNPSLVGCMETALDWSKKKGSGLPLFALVASELWKERNARCFHDTASTIPQVLSIIKHVANQWIEGGACNLGCLIRE
jgi:hypothetical protein